MSKTHRNRTALPIPILAALHTHRRLAELPYHDLDGGLESLILLILGVQSRSGIPPAVSRNELIGLLNLQNIAGRHCQ
jgi:hypothetical protein